jgi:hypothetical protein
VKVAKVRPKAGNFSSGDIEGREIIMKNWKEAATNTA